MPHGLRKSRAARGVARTIRAGASRLKPLFERRRQGRVKAERKVACNLGAVVDLSTGGMQLRSKHRLRGIVDVELWATSRQLKLRAEVVWSKRASFRKYNCGLKFLDTTPEIVRQLTNFAT